MIQKPLTVSYSRRKISWEQLLNDGNFIGMKI
jgi:hypothetical protein